MFISDFKSSFLTNLSKNNNAPLNRLFIGKDSRDAFFYKHQLDLEKQKSALLAGKLLDRTEKLFNNTPIVSSNDFKAANIIYQDTKFEASFSLIKAVLFAGIFGIIFGTFYALISNAIQQRK